MTLTAERPTILYVGGSGRSGSTLLDRILGQVPGVVSTGELARLWDSGLRDNRRCGCGEPFRECPFWSEVGQRAYGGWANVDLARVLYLGRTVRRHRYLALDAFPRLARSYLRRREELCAVLVPLYRSVAEVSRCRVVVDSSKEVVYAMLLRHAFPESLRLLHLIRDGHGVAHSWTKHVAAQSGGTAPWEMDRYSPAHTAVRWSGYNLALEVVGLLGTPIRRLRYEDLIRAPSAELAAVLSYAFGSCDADPMPFLVGQTAEVGVTHTVAGNPVRFVQGQIQLCLDDSWRSVMRPRDRLAVTVLAAPALWRYGYLHGQRKDVRGEPTARLCRDPHP